MSTNISAQDWKTSVKFSPDQTIKDVHLINSDTAYAVSVLYNGSTHNIKKTIDGGKNWTNQSSGYTATSFYEIATPNNKNVFMVGNEGTLITTEDEGKNWTTIDLDTKTHLRDIFFLNDKTGFITGDAGLIFRTEDGGENWIDLQTSLRGSIPDIYFLNSDKGFICGFNFFRITEDGGFTWEYIDGFAPKPGELYQLRQIQFMNDKLGFVAGDVGTFYKTTDGGESWVKKETGTQEAIFDFKFLDENIGFACGFNSLVLSTEDGGETWQTMTIDEDQAILHSLDFYNNKGFITGQTGYIFEFTLPVSVNELLEEGVNISPNPVLSNIFLSDIEEENYSIQIIDMQGNTVNYIQKATRSIDCKDLQSGTYILRFISKNKVLSRSFIKH